MKRKISGTMETMNLLMTLFLKCQGNPSVLNEDVDHLLEILNTKIRNEGKNEIPIADFTEDVPWRVKFIKGHVRLEGREIVVGDLSTLKRTGDAVFTFNGNQITLNFKVGIDNLYGRMGTCRAKMNKVINFSHSVQGRVHQNSISVQITIRLNAQGIECVVDQAVVEELSDFEIYLGPSELQKILNKISSRVVNHFRDNMREKLNAKFPQALQEVLDSQNLFTSLTQ